MTFALDQLNPAMREQAEKKLAEMSAFGTVRSHSIDRSDPGHKRGPKPKRPTVPLLGKAPKVSKRKESALERTLALQLKAVGIPEAERDYRFLPGRRLEIDFCWPDRKIGIEVQGMVHRIKARFEADIEKRALAKLNGWRILEVSGKTIRNGKALEWVQEFLKQGAL